MRCRACAAQLPQRAVPLLPLCGLPGVDEGGQGARGVRLMTMHAAKGLEFEVVFIPGGRWGLHQVEGEQPGERAGGSCGMRLLGACAWPWMPGVPLAVAWRCRGVSPPAAAPGTPVVLSCPPRLSFPPGCNDRLVPFLRKAETPEKVAEERRLFYVSLTRAKQRLRLSHTEGNTLFGLENRWAGSGWGGGVLQGAGGTRPCCAAAAYTASVGRRGGCTL